MISVARGLSEQAIDKVGDLRNRIQDALFQYVKEVCFDLLIFCDILF
jgi:hypothetical protein